MKLSVVIPCYNEEKSLPRLIERCKLLASQSDAEAILVDNGSTDSTPAVMSRLLEGVTGCRSIRVDVNRGYGAGILAGLRAATGDVLAWTHADLQTDVLDTITGFQFFRELPAERLFVKGARYGRPPSDRIFSAGMALFDSLLLRMRLSEINAQPTIFHRRFFETWNSPPGDFSLDLYAYYTAKREGLEVQRFPVHFGAREFGQSHWNLGLKSRIKFIRRTMDYSFRLRRELDRTPRASDEG
jgi:Glycosyltransferases involved in cell wall biogenesis